MLRFKKEEALPLISHLEQITVVQKVWTVEEYQIVVPNTSWSPLLQTWLGFIPKDSFHGFSFDFSMRHYFWLLGEKEKKIL